MTSPLRRKRRITARGPSTSAPRAASLVVALLALAAGTAAAQQPAGLPSPTLPLPQPGLSAAPPEVRPARPAFLPPAAAPAPRAVTPTPAAGTVTAAQRPVWRARYEAD